MMLNRLKACIPLRLGTIVTPRSPAGRRTIFYRDKAGQHWPVERLVVSQQQIDKCIALLAPPQYFRNLLNSYEDLINQSNLSLPVCLRNISVSRDLNGFPAAMKALFFKDYKEAFHIMMSLGVEEIVWDPTGIYTLRLHFEEGSRTYVFQRRDCAKINENV